MPRRVLRSPGPSRTGRAKYGQEVEPLVWFVAKLVLIAVAFDVYNKRRSGGR